MSVIRRPSAPEWPEPVLGWAAQVRLEEGLRCTADRMRSRIESTSTSEVVA
ncbi:MAG: hypothetical protein HYS27_09105 [Deltaproteobacteria bacterium]|nr:hypothetical protein [Deltaproteobacteria bacterium]